ncbi:MAG: hypothetical protein KIT87_23315 [Anaerolineae bacterium]|nr:hypothetical protein [Anaerolineae bacterium]
MHCFRSCRLLWAISATFILLWLTGAHTRADGPPTKLGIGLYRESHAARDAIFGMRPPLVLMQDPSAKLPHEIKQRLPQTLIIGRHSIEDTVSVEGALRYADTIHAKYADLKGAITAWTFYNEPAVQKPGEAEAFDAAQAAFTERMHQYGWQVVGFNFGVGVLEPGDYPRLFPRSLPLVDYIGVHAYGSERDFFMAGPDRDYYALRYRKIRAAILGAGYDKPFLLTETGTWSAWHGKADDAAIIRDYLWLEGQIAGDDYVLGQAPFLLDGFDWEGFKLLDSPALPAFTDYNRQRSPVQYATQTPTPAMTPTPQPTATPDLPPSLEAARQHLPWLRELLKLPAPVRAQAVIRIAQELGVSPVTIYEWLTWLEVNGELGVLVVTPTLQPTVVTTPTATPSPLLSPTPSVYRVFVPLVEQRVARAERSDRDDWMIRRGGPQ